MFFLRLVRYPNLIIVALTQYLLQYTILIPAFRPSGIEPALDHFHFFLLVLSTLSITSSGYIINDILDYEIDRINKPEKLIIDKHISKKNAYRLYHLNHLIGFAIAFYLAWYIENIPLVLMYPGAVVLLYFYSRSWKKKVLIGNVVIAFFCAFVAGIVLFAERKGFVLLHEGAFHKVRILFIAYFIFAFFSTLYREIIKDIEDFAGDLDNGCITLPIKFGQRFAIKFSFVIGLFFLLLIIWWGFFQSLIGNETLLLFVIAVFIFSPTLLSLVWLVKAKEKKDFKRLSRLTKFIMVTGLFYLLFLL